MQISLHTFKFKYASFLVFRAKILFLMRQKLSKQQQQTILKILLKEDTFKKSF